LELEIDGIRYEVLNPDVLNPDVRVFPNLLTVWLND
jgi:hypothetical protein